MTTNLRHIYLIRHGRPAFPNDVPRCIGKTEYPLSETGFREAKDLSLYFEEIPLEAVYCSKLIRAVQTADAIARGILPVFKQDGLKELSCGVWEGLTFEEIKEKYPQLYEKRGTNPQQYCPEQSEPFDKALLRFRLAIEQILDGSTSNIAIVSHASVNRLFLCSLLKYNLNDIYSIRQPYGCINEIREENGILYVENIGYLPQKYPDEDKIKSLWRKYHTPEKVIAHCRAVTQEAMKITEELASCGYSLNSRLIFSAAMLHDLARLCPDHSALGAKWVANEGYDEVAAVIAAHHRLNEGKQSPVTEKTIVFLADKLILEDRQVTLEERFSHSAVKCLEPEAQNSHREQQKQAFAALERIQTLLTTGVNVL